MIYVTKADGSKQPFDKQKIINTCLRLQATPEQAQSIADKIEAKAYDGIPTKKILQMVFQYMKKYRPAIGYQIDLKQAIAMLRSKPDFEIFVAKLFEAMGYEVETNLIIQGKCIEHEIDVVARKGNEIILLEVKHHVNHHTYSGLDVFLQLNSTLEDLKLGYENGKNSFKFTRAILICNTKVSDHGRRYALCKGLEFIAWKFPPENGLERLIEEYKLYPITFLKEIERDEAYSLANAGIVTVEQLLDNAEKISRKSGISKNRILQLQKAAKIVLGISD
ncbi:MAG: ATP cone domain-containing protein [Candidatus Aenigmarchaeota archaeon]|nr:ATP cone domain-containing protein [Candidatus Aenigmarchaeota archaeon]